MKDQAHDRRFRTAVLATALTVFGAFTGTADARAQESSTKLLTARFESRSVTQVEIGDFHFTPGQVAPIHTHDAPAVGYVAKGMIIYQIEGQKPQILREGDVFYEPTDLRVLRFDNASATEEAIFLDFNLETVGEPFIVFEEQPTEAIDRRPLPTITLEGDLVDHVDVFASELRASESLRLDGLGSTLGLVATGVVELHTRGDATRRIAAGGTFFLSATAPAPRIVNASSEMTAKVITFRLRNVRQAEVSK